jgi:ABC-2 type transport system permease protein
MRNRSLVVAAREFKSTVKSKAFILTTIGMPFIFLFFGTLSALPGSYLAAKEVLRDRGAFAIVDESGAVAIAVAAPTATADAPETPTVSALPAAPLSALELLDKTRRDRVAGRRFSPVRLSTREEALAGVRTGRFRAAIVVPQDYVQKGTIEVYEDGLSGTLSPPAEPGAALRSYLVDGLLEGRVTPEVRDRAKDPTASTTRYRMTPQGDFPLDDPLARLGKLAVPVGLMMFLLLAIFISAGYLMKGVAEEKENRVLEVILSSVSPGELLGGKLIGLGAAGLLQLGVWSGGIIVPITHFVPAIEVEPHVLAIGLLQFVLGYLLFGSLVLGFGSLGGNFRESQQWSAVFTLAGGMVPALFMPIVLDEPAGTFARVLSLVPPTAPLCMTMRAALVPVPLLDVALSAAIMTAAVYVALRASARVYRAGTLMIGKTATVREVWRILRTSEEP